MIVAHNDARIVGGLERWLAHTLAALRGRGHDVLLLCREEAMRVRFEEAGVPSRVLHLGGQVAVHDAVRLSRALKELRPDGLLLSSFTKTWLAAMGARLARTPRVVARISWEDYRPGRRFTYRIAFRRWIHRTVANSDAIRLDIVRDLPGLDPARVVTLYNGVRVPVPGRSAAAVRAELGVPEGAPLVGVLARLAGQKRLDRLVDVVAALPGVHALVAGEGPERSALEARARDAGVRDRLHLLGVRDDVGDLLGALDVYLVTSRSEGMSNGMLEAMALGVPVVSTPVSGAREALVPDAGGPPPGVVVEAGALSGEVRRLLGDPGRRAAMGAAGRRRVAERFDREAKLDAWERLLTRDVGADVHEGPSPLRP